MTAEAAGATVESTEGADPVVVESKPDIPQGPWYAQVKGLEIDDSDKGIYDKYKTIEDAIKSIPHRERRLSQHLELPADGAAPDVQEKGHRKILGKMGAPKDADGYKPVIERALKDLPEDVRKKLPESFLDQCRKEAAELAYLPWQFEKHLAMTVAQIQDDADHEGDAQLARQDECEKAMKKRHHLQWQSHATNAELVGSHLDQFLFENPQGLEGEDGNPVKDAFTQLLKNSNNPVLYAACDHLYDLLLSEGDGSRIRRLGGKADDAYTEAYNEAKARWTKGTADDWARYAREKTGGGR